MRFRLILLFGLIRDRFEVVLILLLFSLFGSVPRYHNLLPDISPRNGQYHQLTDVNYLNARMLCKSSLRICTKALRNSNKTFCLALVGNLKKVLNHPSV